MHNELVTQSKILKFDLSTAFLIDLLNIINNAVNNLANFNNLEK